MNIVLTQNQKGGTTMKELIGGGAGLLAGLKIGGIGIAALGGAVGIPAAAVAGILAVAGAAAANKIKK